MRIGVLVVVAACSATPTAKQEVVAPSVVPSPPPQQKAPDDPLNLDFEAIDHGAPKGWAYGREGQGTTFGYKLTPDDDAHRGSRSLKMTSTADADAKSFAIARASIPAMPYRGKRVRLHGWVKSTDVSSPCGLWLTADGEGAPLDNMSSTGVKATTPWHEIVAEIDVGKDAELVSFGPLLVGTGTLWVDSLSLEAVELARVTIAGHVFDRAHRPLDRADIALTSNGWIVQHVITDASGAFSIDAVEGVLGISAHHPPQVAAFLEPQPIRANKTDLDLVLDTGESTTLRVKVASTPPLPSDAFATVSNISDANGDLWAVPIIDGVLTAVVPRAKQGHIVHFTGDIFGFERFAGGTSRVEGNVDVGVLAPPPEGIATYLREHATELTSAEAGHGFSDMSAIGKMVGDAHVVGLGEATHGTREFFQLKHRVLEYLVSQKGFTVFAIEANQPECRAINDYIQNGKGDAKTALGGIYFWVWNTEEVLAMIEWMRAWNVDPKHTRKLEFAGFDMQFTPVAYKNIAEYLDRVAPQQRAELVEPLAALADKDIQLLNMPTSERTKIRAAIAKVGAYLDAHKAEATRRTTARELADARHDVVVLQQWQAETEMTDMGVSSLSRDEAMADNIKWLRDQHPAGTKFVLWAHNGHINRAPRLMGDYLAKTLKADYMNFGFVFGEGSFQARVGTRKDQPVEENTVGPAPASDMSTPFTQTGKPLLVIDLRTLPPGTVSRWFSGVHPMRDVGSTYFSEKSMESPTNVLRDFNALIFVARTTRARPLPKLDAAPK